ncbi:MAG TPA: hypothetical protein QF901_02545, partial [Gammaproteobacteria bacterium]|nr:hypothetical protein [Gammaproteobacteria bacterium]
MSRIVARVLGREAALDRYSRCDSLFFDFGTGFGHDLRRQRRKESSQPVSAPRYFHHLPKENDIMTRARITGTGNFLPEKILSNKDLESMADTTDEWIVKRTGIRERRVAEPGETTSDLAARALQVAIDNAGMN